MMEARNKSKKSFSDAAKSGSDVSSTSDFSSSSTQSNAGSIGQRETMVCHSTSERCPVGICESGQLGQQSSEFGSSKMSQQGSMVCTPSHKCPVIGSSSSQSAQQGSAVGSSARMSQQGWGSSGSSAQRAQQGSAIGSSARVSQQGWGSSGVSQGASGQWREDIGQQQISAGRTHSETKIKGVTDIDTSMSNVAMPSNVQLHSTEFKAQAMERNEALQQQQPMISKAIVPEQHYVHTVPAQAQVVEVMPAQRVQVQEKTVNISDHGLHEKMLQSAQGLNEYMNCLQNEANLLAMEKANKQVLEQTKESICDTSRWRHELEKTASLGEAETIHKLKEAEAAAKQMMADARAQVKQVEKQGHITERITEKQELKHGKKKPTVTENPMVEIDKFIDEEHEKMSPNETDVMKVNERTQVDENTLKEDATKTKPLSTKKHDLKKHAINKRHQDEHEPEMDETDHYGHHQHHSWLTETKNLFLYLFDVLLN